jgi:phosphoribosylformimino-5-aminoimidazole carboxamide ribotide isomerase
MQIIPAIDLIGGKCVRLTKGDYSTKKEYADDPVQVAKRFEAAGIQRLHLVDLDGAKAKKVVNFDVLERIAEETQLTIDFGGGVQSDDDLLKVLALGAAQVTGGSIAVKDPIRFQYWISKLGPEKIILGADVINRKIAIHGWQESSQVDIFEFLENYLERGIRYVICTDVSKDGMLQGPSSQLYLELMTNFPQMKLIASGGIASMDDIQELADLGCYGAITGKAIYENKISLDEIAQWQAKHVD